VVESEHEIRITRSPEAAFDFFADLRNEPEWNHGHVRDVRMTSAPPIGQGTTFEGRHPGFGTATWRLVEYERPRHLVIEGFVGKAPYRYVGDFESVDGGTLFRGRVEWEPRGIWHVLGPLLHPLLRFRVRRSFDNLRIALEKECQQHDD
jgi:Polyketide cyclase / dehydrase and lipid transport